MFRTAWSIVVIQLLEMYLFYSIPQGKLLVHDDASTLHEKDWYLEFDKGIMVGSREVDNTKTFNPDDPYGINDLIIDLP